MKPISKSNLMLDPFSRRIELRPSNGKGRQQAVQLLYAVALTCVTWPATRIPAAEPPAKLDFQRDVRPILSNHCWSCHGPDATTREGGLRLDVAESVGAAAESGDIAIRAGHPETSELVARINASDPAAVMPPPKFEKPLSSTQKETLRRWIAEGAPFAGHWAFRTPVRPPLPQVRDAAWPQTPIDYFVLARLEAEGWQPNPPANRATWLRRVTLDLTGLPPTPDEYAAYESDPSPAAAERVVERLLQTPRHGERMAMQWLDAARYADTNGYNNDEVRTMWPWRDWVIQAFQSGMPYDQFVAEQLAGDLLPESTLDQQIATGFNRNHVLTTEGGIIEEEYQAEYVADRIHTTATVFLGMSFQCARCHEHKYDPLTQQDFYRFAAFFNNIPDKIVGYSQGRMAEPLLKAPSPWQRTQLQQLSARRDELAGQLAAREQESEAAAAQWAASLSAEQRRELRPAGQVAHFDFQEKDGPEVQNRSAAGNKGTIQGPVNRVAGQHGQALRFEAKTHVDAAEVGAFDADSPFTLAAWVRLTSKEPSTVLSKMDDANAYRGYDLIMEDGKLACHVIDHWPDRAFKVVAKSPISLQEWHHVCVTYDGSRAASGMKLYVDGQPQPFDITTNNRVDGTIKTDKPFHIGLRQSSIPFHGDLDEVQLFSVALDPSNVERVASGKLSDTLTTILEIPVAERTPEQRSLVARYFIDHVDARAQEIRAQQSVVSRQLKELDQAIPVTMIMKEMTPRRPTHFLRRGKYDQKGEEMQAGVPESLTPFAMPPVASRLDLARWLTHPAHPLTARVAVNRWWEMLFGQGLVETVEDFGVQGSPPTHPELLDWLATELVRTGWDTRAVLKTIVLSATYQQASEATDDYWRRDPRNRWLGRGPRRRLGAETVRDQALAISGLLTERVGGPSVRPYQPEGLWEDVSVERREKYAADPGEGLFRRSMYTFWKRTCPPPGMTTFDAPDRETCLPRRARTNTPLQALVLLNDPTYVEAARWFASRLLTEASTDPTRIDLAFQLACGRPASEADRADLLGVFGSARRHFQEQPEAANQLLSIGGSPRTNQHSPSDWAAWTVVASVLLNLDEVISNR